MELISQPPGSDGRVSRPATTKLLSWPFPWAAQRCCSKCWTCSGRCGSVASVPLNMDKGDWIFTAPLNPNSEEALTRLVGSIKKVPGDDIDVAALPLDGLSQDLAVLQSHEGRIDRDIPAGRVGPPWTDVLILLLTSLMESVA